MNDSSCALAGSDLLAAPEFGPLPLSPSQGMALLQRLAEDDAFRAVYASDPATALAWVGVPVDAIAMLEPKCLGQRQLAAKSAFATLLHDMQSEATAVAMSMWIPSVAYR